MLVTAMTIVGQQPNDVPKGVESRRDAVAEGVGITVDRRLSPDAGASVHAMAPFPLPAHQTGRADLPHPAFRLASPQGPRRTVLKAGVGRQHPDRGSLRPAAKLPPTPSELNGADRHEASHRPWRLQKHTRSQGPLLHRHYPASTLLRPCPTSAGTAAQSRR